MDTLLAQITRYLWDQSWQIAVLTALVAGVSFLLRHRSAHLRHLLWLVVLAKCLVPPLVNVSLPLLPAPATPAPPPGTCAEVPASFAVSEAPLGQEGPEPLPALSGAPAVPAATFRQTLAALDTRAWLALGWMFGIVVVLSLVGVKAVRTLCWLRRDRRTPPAALQAGIGALFRTLGVRRPPRVWLLRQAGQPFVWGLLRGDIYLPESLGAAGDEYRRDVLAHEVGHVLRHDAAVNLLQILAQAVYWFHPLVWWANRRIRVEREKSCDEMAIARLQTKPRDYSRAIVEVLLAEQQSRRRIPTLAIAGPVKNIEERIRTMLQPGKKFHRRPSLWAAACALLPAVLIVPTTLALTRRPAGPADTPAQTITADEAGAPDTSPRTLSATNLKQLGLGLLLYAMEHEKKYPDEPGAVIPYLKQQQAEQLAEFLSNDAEYLGAGKKCPEGDASGIPLAYDLTLLRAGAGTNVLFADGHVEFVGKERLKGYGIELPQSQLEIQEVRFEPIHQGKNVVHVTARNTSEKEQVLAIHIYTRSPDYGPQGVGWGTPFFATFAPHETRPVRFVFKIQGPVTGKTYVRISFYNPPTQERYDYQRYFERRTYVSGDLEKARADQPQRAPAAPDKAQAVTQAFRQIQDYIQNRQYEQAWERFSKDCQKAEYQVGFEWFRRAMEPEHPIQAAFTWRREDFLKLQPGQVFQSDAVLTLAATLDGQTWLIDFVQQDGQWKIDWIAGYVPEILDMQRQSSNAQAGNNATTSNLKVLDIQFDPIQSGRNAVRLQVQNTSQTEQVFGFDLRTESSVRNWQKQFTESLKPGRTESLRFEFEILGPLENASLIRLRFYNPPSPSPAALDLGNWFEMHRYTDAKFDQHEVTYSQPPSAPPAPAATSHLKVLDVQFEPLQQGKNVLRLQVQNLGGQDEIFGVSVQAHCPRVGGWGTTFFDTIKAGQTQWMRCAFNFRGPVGDDSDVHLSFYNPGPAAGFDVDKWLDTKPWDQWFQDHKYAGPELPRKEDAPVLVVAAPPDQSQAVRAAFQTLQDCLKQGKYENAWNGFTKDYRDAGFFRKYPVFQECMEQAKGPNRLSWLREEFVKLTPESVALCNGTPVLTAALEQQKWSIDFAQEDGHWKMDWVTGYVPAWERHVRWEDYVLPKLEKRSTAHFDIYYFKDSTAGREIDTLAQQKDDGFQRVCRFLGKDSDVRIRLVLFEDGQTKQNATGHQGAGWAYGNTIVEVYNEKEKLDPYHETTHILMSALGHPPALFNEGFATYMSERLGTHALENLGGGQATIHQRAGELKAKGDWIELPTLLSFTEIGSQRTRPPVAYAEAGSFVKFLIDSYGKDKFLQAYASLQNSDDPAVQQENARKLGAIFGKPVAELDAQWQKLLSAPPAGQ
jgi:prepilin-type processing-associated H-X9-DG protein